MSAVLALMLHAGIVHASADKTHEDDAAFVRRWWMENHPGIPADKARALEKWIEQHPDDGEALFLLSQIEAEGT